MTVPIALECPGGIEPQLGCENRGKRWMRRQHLGLRRPAVIGEIIASFESQRAINQTAKRVLRVSDLSRLVVDMQVEDDAGPPLPRPGERRFVVRFDQPYCSVD